MATTEETSKVGPGHGGPLALLLLDVYRRLLSRYGPQHWWLAEEPFEVMVGAILTQAAAWRNVEKAIASLRKAGLLSPASLRDASVAELAAAIRPCGYYNSKARKLKALADWLRERCHDDLSTLHLRDTAELREELLGVYGIGEETADSILLYACSRPAFVVDAYTVRILDRLGIRPPRAQYAQYQALFADNLPEEVRLYNEYHALLVRHGKEVCRRKPSCQRCCLGDVCPSASVPGGTRPAQAEEPRGLTV
ncbi:MAG: endonuclease [Chloroflexota bacterium]